MTDVLAGISIRPRRVDVAASYDLGVEAYDRLWGPVILPAALAVVPVLGVCEGEVVVDVGAGTGGVASAIRSAVPTVGVVAVDVSREMLRVAHVRRGLAAAQADALALPVAGVAVDIVVLAYVLFHLADPLAALVEAARVLRPEGRVATVTWASEQAERAQLVWNEVLADAGVPPLPPRHVDAGLDSLDAIDGLLCRAGLVPRRIWTGQLRHQWDRRSFWELATGSGVNRLRLGLIDPTSRAGVLARLKERLDRLEPADFCWEGKVICAVAAKPDNPEAER